MSWAAERSFEKENAYGKELYEMRTRQYYNPATNKSGRKQPEDFTPEKEKYQYQPAPKFDKYDKYEKMERFDNKEIKEDYSKSGIGKEVFREFNRELNDNSFSECNKLADISMNSQSKKENARKRGFEMRVNNIENINDKITSLLNMVKKDGKSLIGHTEQKTKENNYDRFKENSYHDKSKEKALSPKAEFLDRIKRPQVSSFEAKDTRNSGKKEQPYKLAEEKSYSNYQRPRAPSAMEYDKAEQKPKESNIKPPRSKYNYEEERDYSQPRQKKYGEVESKKYDVPASGSKWDDRLKEKESKYEMEMSPKASLPNPPKDRFSYNKDASPTAQISRERNREVGRIMQERKREVDRFRQTENKSYLEEQSSVMNKWNQEEDMEKKLSPVQTPSKYDRTPQKSRQVEGSFMPITLMRDNPTPNQRTEAVNNTTRMIDEQIKRIKNKINESESHNNKLQQRLTEGRDDIDSRHPNSGQIYSRDNRDNRGAENSPVNKFELKIYPVETEKVNTIKIAEKLSKQAEIDNYLRAGREKFDQIDGEEKWSDLENRLKSRGLKLTLGEIKELIRLSPDEHNPFGRDAGTPKSSSDLADLFCQAQQHWEREVFGCVSGKALKSEGFQVSDLDLNKKGHLKIEDLACFVNLYTGNFYRNRDVALLYRRLQLLEGNRSKSGVDYGTFLRTVAI